LDVLEHFGIKYRTIILERSIRHEDNETFNIMMAARTASLTPAQLKVLNSRVVKMPPSDSFSLVPTNKLRQKLSNDYLATFQGLVELKTTQFSNVTDEELAEYIKGKPKMEFLKGKLRRSRFNFRPLLLAPGCRIMIVKNDNTIGVVNGDMGHVISIEDDVIECSIERTQTTVYIERVFHGFETRDKQVKIGINIYPLRLASAATFRLQLPTGIFVTIKNGNAF